MASMAARNGAARQGIAERRESFRRLMRLAEAPATSCRVEERSIPGPTGPLPARLYAPEGHAAGPLPGMIFFHGGGLVAGDLDTHDGLCRMLAAASGCRVLSVAYRLAPEHRFPAAIDDACAATVWVITHAADYGMNPERLVVGGDSAGGTLASVACCHARDIAAPHIAAQLLLCPVLDFAEESASRREFARGYLLDRATMERDLEDYLDGTVPLDDPRISPLRAPDLGGLPLTLIHTAEFDPLRDEGQAYAKRLRQFGVSVRHTCHPGMIHHFYGMTGIIPRARATLTEIGAQLAASLV